MDIFELVCANMKRIRKERELSQEEVAARMGIKQPNYSRLEKGETKPTLQTLVRASDALECSVEELFYRPEQLHLQEQIKRIERLGPRKRALVAKLLDLNEAKDGKVKDEKVKRRVRALRQARSK